MAQSYHSCSEIINRTIKEEISKFITYANCLTEIQKKELKDHLNTCYTYNEASKADHTNLMEHLDYNYRTQWLNTNLGEVEFYKSVCIENAKINNEPYLVAKKALEEFNIQFNRNKD